MAKLRLNSRHRDDLNSLARKLVACPAEKGDVDAAYTIAAHLVRRMVEAVLPPADMRILQKYECAQVDDCTRITLTAGGMVQFVFNEGTGPLSTNCRTFLADEATTHAVTTYKTAKEKHKEALKAKLNDYNALIYSARYFEDVAEVWPEAEQLRDNFDCKEVSVVTGDVIARIQQDMATRAATAEIGA